MATAGLTEGIEKLAETLLEADGEREEEGQLLSFFLLSEVFLVPNIGKM